MSVEVEERTALAGRPARRGLLLLAAGVAAASAFFVLVRSLDAFALIAPLRLGRLAPMMLVGVAVAVSTVVFQTVTENRILTPSIMGFDALYAPIQTLGVFMLGSTALIAVDPVLRFAVETVTMVAFSAVLYRWIFGGARRSLYLLVLVGIVLGTFFRSLATFMQRVIDPNEYLIVVDRLFASFSAVDGRLLAVSAVVVAAASAWIWTMRHDLDVLTLGRDRAVALGVDHRRVVMRVLLCATGLVAVSTALVGPITFLGLLVVNLTYHLLGTHRHAVILPGAALVGVLTLVGAQGVLEHLLGMDTVVAVVIEFAGGIVFIAMLIRGGRQ